MKLVVLYKNPNELKPNPKNARTHSKKQVHQITQSIKTLGFNNPVLIEVDGTIIAGHGRVEAAKELGLESIPTICLEHMSAEQVRAYIIADNKLAEKAGWDMEILKNELDFLMNLDTELGFDATITGFETPEIDLIINPEAIEDAKSESDAEDDFFKNAVEIPKRANKGDLYRLGEHLAYCGDAFNEASYQKLLGNDRAQVIFSDPPYNVKVQGRITKQKHHTEFAQGSGEFREFPYCVLEMGGR